MTEHGPSGGVAAEVYAAAAELVAAFGAHRVEEYFECFTPDATFVFHDAEERLDSREAYQRRWRSWERDDGFRVLSCHSTEGLVQVLSDDVAVFSHRVRTITHSHEGEATRQERETIVFVRRPEGWRAVHEHLSLDPAG